MVRIPVTSNASFEEVLEDGETSSSGEPVNIEQLAQLLDRCGTEIRVRLTRASPDVSTRRHYRRTDDDDDDDDDDVDLPCDSDISLTAVVMEPCVFASVDSADRPAFHLPVRTDIDVRLVRYLDKRDSPLLSGNSRRLSTMDRCVEALCDDHLAAFITNCRHNLSTDYKRSIISNVQFNSISIVKVCQRKHGK